MAKKSRKKISKPEMAKPELRVYVGPSLPGGVLLHGTVFKDKEYPTHVAKAISDNPVIGGLIVPISQLAEAKKAVQIKGNLLNTYALKIREKP